ncbi:MAG: hypothetical protein HUJ13_04465 [Hydrogenovibrio crunogenus]|uniref:Uncharacterized protein n=1 Tax=Hydrogenovibrio crunogenus (strain DSM 25203 / XCL-2) TaxID=317025 RepID=Q31E15_HYDCU|nr:hypothetical protein [Hydrogenovibrio crunogenus]
MKFQKTFLASSMALALTSTPTYAAFDDAGTDYTNAKQNAHMWTPGMEALDNVNSILCFVEQLKTGEMVNKGRYTALVNEAKCDTGGGDSRDKAPKQQFVIVESVRASDTAAQKTKVWIPGMSVGDGAKGLIKAYASISAEPTQADPLQDFTLRYDMYDESGVQKIGGGYIKATPSSELENGKIGIEFYEQNQFGSETYTSAAKIIKNPDGSDGVAITRAPSWNNNTQVDKYYGLSWNETTKANRVLIKDGDFATNNSDLNGTQSCLAKDQLKTAVWQYGVYDQTTGNEVTLNSGFPISYGSNKQGYIGYWGYWTEDETLPTGDVYKIDYTTEPPTKTAINVSTAPGKLWKNQLKTLTMADIAGVEFEYGAWDNTTSTWQNYLIAYNGTTSQFEKLATVTWGTNGKEVTQLSSPQTLTLNTNDRMFLWSDQLGGQVTISTDGAGSPSSVVIAEKSLVTPDSTDLAGEALSLTCFDRCPKADISTANLSGENVYETTDFSSGYTYTFSKSNMTLANNTGNIAFASTVTKSDLQSSNYQWGVQSGMLIPTANAGSITGYNNLYDGSISTWYEWETGLENWNQYTMVSDASGNAITFDEPLKFELQYVDSMARNGGTSKYNNQNFFLEYGGNGDLWGFPNVDVGDGFFYPAIALKDGTALTKSGDTSANYVVKAWQMEQKMTSVSVAPNCDGLALGDVPGGIPTIVDATLPVNTDSVPSVDGLEPAVINGVVQ